MLAESMLGFTAMEIPDFVAGLLYGFTGDNHLTEIETCFSDEQNVFNTYVKDGIADLHKGGIDWELQAGIDFALAALNVPVALHQCGGMGNDLKAIEEWGTIFKQPERLTATVSKNYLFHKKSVKADIATFKSDWAAKEYFKSGTTMADLLTTLIGPVTVTPTEIQLADSNLGFTVMEIPDFIAGLLYGWTGDNNLTEFEACYTSDLPILEDIQASLQDLEHGHIIHAIEAFEKAVYNLQAAMEPCHAMQDDIAAIDAWAAMFKEPASLIKTVGLHWELH